MGLGAAAVLRLLVGAAEADPLGCPAADAAVVDLRPLEDAVAAAVAPVRPQKLVLMGLLLQVAAAEGTLAATAAVPHLG